MCLVWCLLLCYSWLARALAVCYGMDGIELSSNYIPCDADVTGTGNSHSACCNAASSDLCLPLGLCLSTKGIGLEDLKSSILSVNGCTDTSLAHPSCPQYCRGLGDGIYSIQYCHEAGGWCCAAEGDEHDDCCQSLFQLPDEYENAAQKQKLAERANGGNPFGTFTMPTTADEPTATTPLATATTTSQPTSTTPTTGTLATTPTLSTKSTSNVSTLKQSSAPTAPSSSASLGADAASPGSDTSREALIAGLSVVSAIAAVSLLVLVAALLYIRRLSHRNRDLLVSSTAAPAIGNHHPHSVGDPYETMTVHNATPAIRTSIISNNIPQAHELSPIREQSESSVRGRLSGGGVSGILGSRSSVEVFDGFGEEIDWGGINGGIVIAELPESSTPRLR